MSEVVESGMTAGGLLKEARQAAGMHIAALAVALKVPVSKLEALEADNYAVLPDTVFVRALASSVCVAPSRSTRRRFCLCCPRVRAPGCLWTAPASMRL